MSRFWLDANVILRYLTDSPRDQALRVQRVMKRAEDGQKELVLDALIVAEIVWVLTSSIYNFSMEEIATKLIPFLISDKLQIPERDLVISAIELARDKDVDFIDAYLALRALAAGDTVYTFDKTDFRKLPAKWAEP
jgi:predicted nucleic acid-binding protein